jgi:hypothetical protein
LFGLPELKLVPETSSDQEPAPLMAIDTKKQAFSFGGNKTRAQQGEVTNGDNRPTTFVTPSDKPLDAKPRERKL